jgi:hypothetical protein
VAKTLPEGFDGREAIVAGIENATMLGRPTRRYDETRRLA